MYIRHLSFFALFFIYTVCEKRQAAEDLYSRLCDRNIKAWIQSLGDEVVLSSPFVREFAALEQLIDAYSAWFAFSQVCLSRFT